MKLRYITCSDPREDIPVQSMINFATQYPKIEFGVQAHVGPMSSKASRNIWFNQIVNMSENMKSAPNLALHVNYEWCDIMCSGCVPCELKQWLNRYNRYTKKPVIKRIQLNIGDNANWFEANKIADLIKQFPDHEFIFPWNESVAQRIETLKNTGAKFSLLFDGSYGAGISPSNWSKPVYPDVPNGYAGGLGPDNIEENLDKINKILPSDYTTWVDAEGRLRDRFTTRSFTLELAEKYGKNAWFRVQFTDGSFGDWIFFQKFCSKQICASIAALWCTCNVDNYAKALGLLDDKANIKQQVNSLKQNIR